MKQRNQYLDILRGVALIFMVFGHCLQYGNGTEFIQTSGFFYNRVFAVIYSFHMPLFILISGYLFSFTVVRCSNWKSFLKNRFERILLPIIGWQTFHYLIKGYSILQNEEITFVNLVIKYVRSWFTDIWFLWAIIYCSLAVYLVRKYLNDRIYMYFIIMFLTLVTPDNAANLHLYKYMYPFFVSGYLFGKYYKDIRQYILKMGIFKLFVAALAGYLVLFHFWRIDSYIYTSGYSLWGKENMVKQFGIDMYRMAIGFAGCAVVVFGIKFLYGYARQQKVAEVFWKMIALIGQQSLCIYLLSSEMVHWFLEDYSDYYHFSYLGTVLETIILIAICYWISVLISKISILNRVLLGGK